MVTRILHCSTSIQNYLLCLDNKVAGFTNRGPQPGDLVYLVVKVGKHSLCGARFVLDEPTDNKPWEDADNYVNMLTVRNIEYCQPFDIAFLAAHGGKYWGMKYLQGSKPISDPSAVAALNEAFQQNKTNAMVRKEVPADETPAAEDVTVIEDDRELQQIQKEVLNARIAIMGTFQIA